MGNTCNEILIKIKDEIWEYLKTGNIDSAGYFPGDFNRKGGLKERPSKILKKEKLNTILFQKI